MFTNAQIIDAEYNRPRNLRVDYTKEQQSVILPPCRKDSRNFHADYTEEPTPVVEDDLSNLLEEIAKEMEENPRAFLIF